MGAGTININVCDGMPLGYNYDPPTGITYNEYDRKT